MLPTIPIRGASGYPHTRNLGICIFGMFWVLLINGSNVDTIRSTKFPGVHISDNLIWSANTGAVVKKAHQPVNFMQRQGRGSLPPPFLTTSYRGTLESVLTSNITVWFGNCTAQEHRSLQCILRSAESPSSKHTAYIEPLPL